MRSAGLPACRPVQIIFLVRTCGRWFRPAQSDNSFLQLFGRIELFLVEIRCAAGNDLLDLAGLLSCYQSICCKSCYIAVPCGGAAGCALCYAVYPVLKLYIVGIDEAKDPVLLDCGCNFEVLSGCREGRAGKVDDTVFADDFAVDVI